MKINRRRAEFLNPLRQIKPALPPKRTEPEQDIREEIYEDVPTHFDILIGASICPEGMLAQALRILYRPMNLLEDCEPCQRSQLLVGLESSSTEESQTSFVLSPTDYPTT